MPRGSNRRWSSPAKYPRTARVNEVLREVIATTLEEVSDEDPRLELVTVTGVVCDPDLRHATVYFSALASKATHEEVIEALDDQRVELQAAVGSEVRLKRTPLLRFIADPAIAEGQKVENILVNIRRENKE